VDDYGHDLGLDLFEDEFIEPCKPETKSAAAKHSHNDAFFVKFVFPNPVMEVAGLLIHILINFEMKH